MLLARISVERIPEMPQKGNRNDDAEMRQEKAREKVREKENATGYLLKILDRLHFLFLLLFLLLFPVAFQHHHSCCIFNRYPSQ
jgi:hypothetical protein